MANQDAPFGLRPVRSLSGAPYNGAANKYYIPASYGTALFIGDPVIKSGTSNTALVQSGNETHAIGTLPEINRATAGDGNAITGVIVGFEPDPANRSRIHNPASTERVALVADDPNLLFLIQADGTVAAASVGLNAVLIYTHAGSTATGYSGVELDTTSDVPAADASNQLTIQAISKDPENSDVGSANVNVLVKINQHTESDNVLGL